MSETTLLAIGSEKDFDAFKKFRGQVRFFRGSGVGFKGSDYISLLKGEAPAIKTTGILIFPFFPFDYWDKHIEPKNYKGVYGNKTFYTKFNRFWTEVEKKIDSLYPGKRITYINHPRRLAKDRDKEITKRIVSRAGIPVPKEFRTRCVRDLTALVHAGHNLFIKVRFGSMGKGITYIEKGRWLTNFRFRKGKIASRKSDYGWSFINVTGNTKFLKELLRKDVIVEEAADPLLIGGRKLDLRMYVFKNKVLYTYCRTNDADAVTTNISQGGRGESLSFERKLPKKQLALAKRQSVEALKALGLNFGGVDVMLCSDRKSTRFIEINAFPGFPRTRRYNLSKYLIQAILKDYKT